MSTLDLIGISKRYNTTDVLEQIDIALADGEFLVLLGASGCGKSTLLNIIAGLASPTSGEVRVDGRLMRGVHPKNRDIAMVFQSYALYPNLSVARNIGFALEMRRVPKADREKKIRSIAELLQITHLLDRRPALLSGGQRQRVAIGRALVRDPKVFLFDEPLSNLDAKLRTEMRAELKRLHHSLGTTIVYVTHDQVEGMTLATRIALMNAGRVEQLGTPWEVYNRPATTYVASFVGSPSMNLISGRIDQGRFEAHDCPISLSVGARDVEGREVVLGFRPEALGLASGRQTGEAFAATTVFTELTGPELVVTARSGLIDLSICLPPQVEMKSGAQVGYCIRPDGIHLFDGESGTRIA